MHGFGNVVSPDGKVKYGLYEHGERVQKYTEEQASLI